jgi:hypothetical protein
MTLARWKQPFAALAAMAILSALVQHAALNAAGRKRSAKFEAAPSETPTAAIQWEYDLKTAYRFSVATGRPLLIVFSGPNCGWCRKLERDTLGDAGVAALVNGSFIPLHLDSSKHRRAAEILEVDGLPSSYVLNADADLLAMVEGYHPPTDYARVLRQSLELASSLEREKRREARSGRP